jgi:hypothetical protein
VLETFRKLDAQASEAASRVADELIKAEDLDKAIQEFASMIDERVLDVLMRDMQVAQAEGARELAARIQQVLEALQQAAGASMPPSIDLIFKLVEADYPHETKALLDANRELVNDDFLTLLDVFIQDVAQSDSYEPAVKDQLLRHLRNVLTQAKLS